MKKFFFNIPIQQPGQLTSGVYDAVDNRRLAMEEPTRFPILTAVNGFVEAGEAFRVIAIAGESASEKHNLALFRTELGELCKRRGIQCPNGVETVSAAPDQRVVSHVSTFEALISLVEDDDELFACVTYGTKPQSMALLTAIRYAYRLKKNTSISCIVYGNVDRERRDGVMVETGRQVYDETAMAQLDEITRMLAERGVQEPEIAIKRILSL